MKIKMNYLYIYTFLWKILNFFVYLFKIQEESRDATTSITTNFWGSIVLEKKKQQQQKQLCNSG
jgi:hypothetical protein